MNFETVTQDTWSEWLMVGSYLAFLMMVIWGVFLRKSGDRG